MHSRRFYYRFTIIFFLLLLPPTFSSELFSQEIKITEPQLEFDGKQVVITYDILAKHQNKFYVWVEMTKKNGEQVKMKSVSGSIGENIRGGKNKKIYWNTISDSIVIDDDISLEIKAEKYIRSFNKGSIMLKSAVFPGWGQYTLQKEKPWWIAGLVTYSTLAGGIIFHSISNSTYDSYSAETDPTRREELYNKAQTQNIVSNALLITGATVWVANVLQVALTRNSYKPLNHFKLTLNRLPYSNDSNILCSFKLDF